ncbi:MAG TPA: hypothetical protein PLZ18_07560, partial [Ferruginibacter sp.]|nr:hypothetical protein [Ferruginibacter sp.]
FGFSVSPRLMSGRWSPLFILILSAVKYQELSNRKNGGSRVCPCPLCRFSNLPITRKYMILPHHFEKKCTLKTNALV